MNVDEAIYRTKGLPGWVTQEVGVILADEVKRLRTKLDEANSSVTTIQKAAGFCDKHKPNGGSRNCLVCGCEESTHALSEIDYCTGEPNDEHVSCYDIDYDERAVVERVKRLKVKLEEANANVTRLENLLVVEYMLWAGQYSSELPRAARLKTKIAAAERDAAERGKTSGMGRMEINLENDEITFSEFIPPPSGNE